MLVALCLFEVRIKNELRKKLYKNINGKEFRRMMRLDRQI
jgi:hypothetical protein